jgi:hypothetical protein
LGSGDKSETKVTCLSTWRPFFRGDDSIVADAGLFPSEHSARWWFRRHAMEAVRAGAVIKHRGLWLAEPEKLSLLVAEIGRREALAGVQRCTD